MELPIILYSISILTAVGIWGLRLEGKVNSTDQKIEFSDEITTQRMADLKELINTKFDDQSERLGRIERALNGSLNRGH